MATLVLVRHGESTWNAEGRWQGQANPPLSERGREQAHARARSLEGEFDALYSSDLARAHETAEILGATLGLEVKLDARLREVDVGEWSGLTPSEVEERYPEGLERRLRGGTGWEHGEDRVAMGERVLEALREIAATRPNGRVLVVTHGGPMHFTWLAADDTPAVWQNTANCDVDEYAVGDGRIRWLDSIRRGGLHQQVQR